MRLNSEYYATPTPTKGVLHESQPCREASGEIYYSYHDHGVVWASDRVLVNMAHVVGAEHALTTLGLDTKRP